MNSFNFVSYNDFIVQQAQYFTLLQTQYFQPQLCTRPFNGIFSGYDIDPFYVTRLGTLNIAITEDTQYMIPWMYLNDDFYYHYKLLPFENGQYTQTIANNSTYVQINDNQYPEAGESWLLQVKYQLKRGAHQNHNKKSKNQYLGMPYLNENQSTYQ
jgi:hypothetical protein